MPFYNPNKIPVGMDDKEVFSDSLPIGDPVGTSLLPGIIYAWNGTAWTEVVGDPSSDLRELIQDTEDARDLAVEAANRPPTPNTNDTWDLWDANTRAYVDSGKPSIGRQGPQGEAATIEILDTVTLEPGEPAAMVERAESTPSARLYDAHLPKGAKGDAGSVLTVGGVSPDVNGNVPIQASDVQTSTPGINVKAAEL